MKDLALSINGQNITAPGGVPSGGFADKGVSVIQVALTLLLIFGDVLAVVFVVIAGIQWIISGGDKQKIQAARNRLIYSIIGLVVISLSLFIVQLVTTLVFGGGGSGGSGGGGSGRFLF